MNLQLIKYFDRYLGIPLCYILKFFDYLPSWKNNNKIKKILLAKFSGFGNIVLALPSIRAVRKKYPNAEIVFITHTINKSVVEKEPSINRVITFDVNGALETFMNILYLIKKLRKENFDLIIDFEQFSRFSAVIFFLSGARIKVGFNTPRQGRGILYDIKVPYEEKHTSQIFKNMVSAVGSRVDMNDSKIFITSNDKEKINDFLKKNKVKETDILIGIHPGCGANNPQRKWPKKNFAKLSDFLIENYNVRIFFTGSNSEKNIIQEIMSMMKHPSLDTSGLFNLRELAYIISKCRIFFSNDTGPLHIASAMKIPVAAFFGPNTPALYGPLGNNNLVFYKKLKCSPCTTNFNEKTTKCKHFKCIKTITFEEVRDSIKKLNILSK